MSSNGSVPRYDAVWTAALVLDRSPKAANGDVVAAELLATWRTLEFEGATGHVHFDDKQDRCVWSWPEKAAC